MLSEQHFEREWIMPSEYGREVEILQELRSMLAGFAGHDPRLEDVCTGLAEAFVNAAEHGNGLDSGKRVCVRFWASESAFRFRVYDEGEGFEWPLGRTEARPGRERIVSGNLRGWGLRLLEQLSDRLSFERGKEGFFMEAYFTRGDKGADGDGA